MQPSTEGQLQIKFVTKQQIYAVPDVPFSVPSTIDVVSLNKLVNELLRENNADFLKPIEFDFLVLEELLRVPLYEHLQTRAASTEATVEIEYLERTPAPQPQDALMHDDWVSGIEVSDKWILTGCYDNTVHIWSTKGKHITASNQHTNCVRSVKWLQKNDSSKGFVSVSHDLTGILWHWEPGTTEMTPAVVLRGHERGLDTVAVNEDGSKLVTAGWDTNIKLWSASLQAESDEPPTKRTRGMITRVPIHTLKGHKESVSSAVWIDNRTVCTASMDHTIKFWDIDLYGIKNEIIAHKAFLCCAWSPLSRTLITTSADRHLRLYDPRSAEGAVCKTTYTSHTAWVAAVAWSPHSDCQFMSGGYDNAVKVWDVRSPRAPLYELSGHEDKVMCVDWARGGGERDREWLVSGGADNRVHVFKGGEKKGEFGEKKG